MVFKQNSVTIDHTCDINFVALTAGLCCEMFSTSDIVIFCQKKWIKEEVFLGDLNHTLNNVWWWKITCRHQRAKYVNTSLKVFYLFDFSHIWFSVHFWAEVYCPKCQKNEFLILQVFIDIKYGWHGEFGVWLYIRLHSLEMVGKGCVLRKCR